MKVLLKQIGIDRKIWKWIALGYTIFCGMWSFPLQLDSLNNWTYLYTFLFSYLMIAGMLAGVYKKESLKIAFYSLISSGIGMGLRYLLEFGEVSNTRNFTMSNITLFIIMVPLLITLVARVIANWSLQKEY